MRTAQATLENLFGSPVRNLLTILGLMTVIVIVATTAYMAAGWSFADASYMVLLTVYTVGFEEVRPISTTYLHVVTMATMVLGCTGMILLTSAVVQLFTELQLRQIFGTTRMQNRIDQLSNHVVICGFGRIGVMLAHDLADAKMPLVVLERSPEKLKQASDAGHLCLPGDATADAVLIDAGIARARVLATVLPDDAANVFITLSARSLNPQIQIIARGEMPTTESKLRHAGANQVVLPTHIGAERIARLVLYPERNDLGDEAALRKVTQEFEMLGLTLETVVAAAGSAMAGLSVTEAERRGDGAFFIVHLVGSDGVALPRPGPNETIPAGARVTVVAREGGRLFALFSQRGEVRVGRNVF